MIGRLCGLLAHLDEDGACLVEVGGVGYEVLVPQGRAVRLPAEGEEVLLWVHTVVREDAFTLYGFPRRAERDLFRVLIGLSHVGPKLAASLLGHLGVEGLAAAVAQEDRSALQAVPGVGKKTAERLLVELRDRVPAPLAAAGAVPGGAERGAGTSQGVLPDVLLRVQAVLERLGFRPQEARAAAQAVAPRAEEGAEEAELVREALRSLG